ncbi:hypothetical protein Golax_000955, partial [Gossypium laxum]|nr:hypothetical protein [Gossypium laxum]
EAIGYSRGIWVGWKDLLRVDIIRSHPQFVLIRHFSMTGFFVFVYGSPDHCKRRWLWEVLNMTIPCFDFPWVVIGDFNAILAFNEK